MPGRKRLRLETIMYEESYLPRKRLLEEIDSFGEN